MKQHEYTLVLSGLNRVSRLTTVGKADNARELIALLVSVLRYRHSRKGQLVPVSAELEAVGNFSALVRECFGNSLDLRVSAPEDGGGEVFIPHYAIMTFAENSLLHAYDEEIAVWRLNVSVVAHDGSISVEVSDNGRGFHAEEYLNGKADSDSDYGSLGSTLSRLESYYGDRYTISVDSSPDTGTAVSLSLLVF